MSVVYKTNYDLLRESIITCVNGICALRNQLHLSEGETLDDAVKASIETSIIELSTRLDDLVKHPTGWALPKLDNQILASQKFEQDYRMAEYNLWAQEINKQVVMGNLMFTPGFTPPWMQKAPAPEPPPVDAEIIEPPKPKKRKKK